MIPDYLEWFRPKISSDDDSILLFFKFIEENALQIHNYVLSMKMLFALTTAGICNSRPNCDQYVKGDQKASPHLMLETQHQSLQEVNGIVFTN